MTTFIIAALSADGFIAKNSTHAATWTSKEDKEFFAKTTKRAGVVVMGSTTFQTIGKPLNDRLNIIYSHKNLRLELENLSTRSVRSKEQTYQGVEVTQKKPRELLSDLALRGYQEVAIIGGSHIYTLFMEAGVINTLYLTIEPVLFGKGISLFTKEIDASLALLTTQRLGAHSILLQYQVVT